MQTMNPKTDRPKSPARSRRLVVAAACAAVALLAGLAVKLWLDQRPPPPDADAERLARYMASPAFATLSEAEKVPYQQAFQRVIDRGELTPPQQRGVLSNRTGPDPLQVYFSLARKEREKYLDEVIDAVLKAEKEARLPRPPDEAGAQELRIDGGRLADATPPEDRARMGQFLQDLHDRRVARGVSDDGKFLFPR